VWDAIKEEEKEAKLESQSKSFFNCSSATVVFRRDLNKRSSNTSIEREREINS
jgi:hypothetical protein